MDTSLIYFEKVDFVAIALCAVVAVGILGRTITRRDSFDGRDWRAIRFSLLIPVLLVTGLSFWSSGGFSHARLIYYVGATVYPMMGTLLVIALVRRKRIEISFHRFATVGLIIVLFGLAPLAFWMTFIETRWLDVTETVVRTNAPKHVEPIRVVVLTDVQTDHFGEWEKKVVRETNALNPDIILIPGDLLQTTQDRYAIELIRAREFLGNLRAKHGVYVVQGDADRNIEHYLNADASSRQTEANRVAVLRNETVYLQIKGRSVALSGTELRYTSLAVREFIKTVELNSADAELNLLFAHRPATVTQAETADSSIDLVVAGHTHGGQISIPFFGPPVTLSPMPRHIADGGLGEHSGRQIYVSRGIGLERMNAPRMRLNCRPELALLLIQ